MNNSNGLCTFQVAQERIPHGVINLMKLSTWKKCMIKSGHNYRMITQIITKSQLEENIEGIQRGIFSLCSYPKRNVSKGNIQQVENEEDWSL